MDSMPPKISSKRAREASSAASTARFVSKKASTYDMSRFVSKKASEAYHGRVGAEILLPEQRLDAASFGLGDIFSELTWWENLIDVPVQAVVPIVREFYSNVCYSHNEFETMVRGLTVKFDGNCINRVYGLPPSPGDEDDDYFKNLENTDMDAIAATIIMPGFDWEYDHGDIFIQEDHLTVRAKGLHKFICSRIFPTKDTSDVTWVMAVLSYTILTGGSVDVGSLIADKIQDYADQDHDYMVKIQDYNYKGLGFPSLITALCAKAGVVWSSDLEILRVQPSISYASLVPSSRAYYACRVPKEEEGKAADNIEFVYPVQVESQLANSRAPRAHQVPEEEACKSVDDDEAASPVKLKSQLEDLSSCLGELKVDQDLLRDELRLYREERRQADERVVQFQGWVSSMLRGIATHTGMDPTSIPSLPSANPDPVDE